MRKRQKNTKTFFHTESETRSHLCQRKPERKKNSCLLYTSLAPQDRQILFGQLYENGFLIKTADDKAPEVAVGWRERKLNGKYDFKWLYAGKFAEGISEEASTKEGKLSPTTKSIKGSFYERSLDNAYEISVDESNLVKENTKAADAIKSWFSKVQEKNDACLLYTSKITAGEYVRLACQRHLDDIEKSKAAPYKYYFDVEKSEEIINFAAELTIAEGCLLYTSRCV